MPNIPGMPIAGGIPRLGQGVVGGGASLAGLPGGAGGSNIPGLPSLSAVPHIQISPTSTPQIPAPALLHPNTSLDQAATDHTKERLDHATQILMRVRAGQLEPRKAAKLLDDLTPDERRILTKTVLDHHAAVGGPNPQAELQALRYLPVDAKASVATGVVKPAGIGTNLVRDAGNAVIGMPAGIALAGKALVDDSLGQIEHPSRLLEADPRKRYPETYSKIAKPIGESYAHQYGPLVHGDVGEFGHRLEQHPLGPALDALSVVSAGLGTAGRVADATAALRAGRVADITQAAVPGAKLYHGSTHIGDLDPELGSEGGIYLTSHPDVAEVYSGQSKKLYSSDVKEPVGKTHEVFLPDSAKIFDASQPVTPKIADIADKIITKEANLLNEYRSQLSSQDQTYLKTLEDLGARIKSGDFQSVDELRHGVIEARHHLIVGGEGVPGGDIYEKFMKQTATHLKDSGYSGAKLAAWPGDVREAQSSHGLNLGEAAPTDEHLIWDKKILQPPRKAPAVAKVGDQYSIHEHMPKLDDNPALDSEPKASRFSVREQGKIVGSNFPDKESAIKHAQSLISPYKSPLEAFIKGGGDRGRLVDRYDTHKGYDHVLETTNMMKEIADVLDKPNLRLNRRTLGQVLTEVKQDLQATRAQGKARGIQIASDNPSFYSSLPIRKSLATSETALREASDLVRAGAIYLRPAYLPNNWVGNFFMNSVHQGVLAPVNLAKSLVVDKYIGKRYTAAMDKAMGQNAAEVITAGVGKGYVGSLVHPIAHSMGMLADQPFRRAAFLHEARRAGYSKLTDVQKLFDRASRHEATVDGQVALKEIANIGRKAQEEIVKFGHMNDAEKSIVRNLIFVYSWVRGSARYAARFPLQHPIQSNIFHHLSQDVGNPYLAKEMGGVPNYMAGAIPVGRDSKGNPIVINPFNLNPLGTAVSVGQAVAGTIKAATDPKHFNKYVDQDIANVTHPLIQSYLSSREGGKPMIDQMESTLAPVRLAKELQHPGSGSVFPTSRTEALGHYVVGSMFPRVADQAALTKSLERAQKNNPMARIPTDVQTYKKLTGSEMPSDLIGAYKGDLEQVQLMKDFQGHYASSHGQSGFRNLPPANKVEAAIQFLEKYHLASKSDLDDYKATIPQLPSDADLNSFANTLFSSTGIGQYKAQWDSLMRDARGLRVTRKRG